MDLRFELEADGSVTEVAVEVEPDRSVAELTAALVDHLGLPAPAGSWALEVRSRAVDGGEPVGRSGIRIGDRLVLVGNGARSTPGRATGSGAAVGVDTPPVVELTVAGGPAAGRRFPLGLGPHVVGRSSRADVSIDDGEISRRHLEAVVNESGVTITDLGSSNGTFIDGARLSQPQLIGPDTVVELGRTLLRFEAIVDARESTTAIRDVPRARGDAEVIPFNRPPRRLRRVRTTEVTLPTPPAAPTRRRLPVAGALIPLVSGIAMAAVDRRMLFLALLAPLWAVGSFLEDRFGGRRDRKEAVATFRDALAAADRELDEAHREELAARRDGAPDPAALLRLIARLDPRLWERRPTDADFLALRLGFADLASDVAVAVPAEGEPRLRADVEAVATQRAIAAAVPATVNVAVVGSVGISGPPASTATLARWLVTQAAGLHSPRDLSIAAVVGTGDERWDWLSWLPHVNGEALGSDASLYATSSDAGRNLVERLGELISERAATAGGPFATSGQPPVGPTVLVLVEDSNDLPRHAFGPLLERGPSVGVHVIWVGGVDPSQLPGECGAVITIADEPSVAALVVSGTDDQITDISPDAFSLDQARAAARDLAPVRDVGAGGARGAVPRSVGLLDFLDLEDLTAQAVVDRWEAGAPGVAGALGQSSLGVFDVDLRKDGPHALVGGTTGAGKSELLQTLVASLAANYPPNRLTFLLIDYKGGAAFKDCVDLPHTIGLVTDLDGHLVHRALVSLNAELRRREHVLADAGAKDLIDMERLDPAACPANLVLIVDEFATLAKELPEFVDGVVNVAQRGRSLGIHLVLATQRPAGAINDNIRANTNLRIALRMNDAADSDDVIGAPDAAALPRSIPGRAFARTGHSELTELQVAYGGGRVRSADHAARPILVMPVRGGRPVRPPAVANHDDDAAPTELQALVATIGQAAHQLGVARQPAPWMAPLPAVLPLDRVLAVAGAGEGDVATIGVIDEPELQRQRALRFDLEADGSLLVYGTGGTGKTTLLRTFAASLAVALPPTRVHLYGVDLAGRGLEPLEVLPHTGAVLGPSEPSAVERLFRDLRTKITDRAEKLATVGAATLSEYERSTGDVLPRVVVLIDGYSALHAAFEKVDYGALLDEIPRIVGDGRSVGVHLVITADRRNAVPSTLTSVMGSVFALRLGDVDDLGMLGFDLRIARSTSLAAGRGFVSGTKEVQVAIVGDDPAGDAQARALAALAPELVERHGAAPPVPPVATLPTDISFDDAVAGEGASAANATAGTAALAIGDVNLRARGLRLADGNLLVAGPGGSGRSSTLATIARGLRRSTPGLTIVLLAARRTPAERAGDWDRTAVGAEAVEAEVTSLLESLAAGVARGGAGDDERCPDLAVLVDDADELLDTAAEDRLAELVRASRGGGVWIALAAEVRAAHRAYSDLFVGVRRDRHGVLLQPDPLVDGDLVGAQLPKRSSGQGIAGRGYLVTPSSVELIQVLRPDQR